MSLKCCHQSRNVLLKNKCDLNQGHAQLIDEIDHPLLQRHQAINGRIIRQRITSLL
jgi:hypothetical protein